MVQCGFLGNKRGGLKMVTKQTKNSPYPQTKALPRSCDLQKYLRGIDFYIKLWGGGLISMASQENNKVA